jgi:hypothetical protein
VKTKTKSSCSGMSPEDTAFEKENNKRIKGLRLLEERILKHFDGKPMLELKNFIRDFPYWSNDKFIVSYKPTTPVSRKSS